MKKIVLMLTFILLAPMAHAAAEVEADTIDLWSWMASFFESQSNDEASQDTSAQQQESIQDESRSFTSIIR